MEKEIKALLKRLQIFVGCSKQDGAKFILSVFSENDIFSLPEKNQKAIIKNLLLYFDTLICGIDTYKKRNIHFSESDILNHIKEKVFDLKAISKNVVIY
jgi:hypothetical protein